MNTALETATYIAGLTAFCMVILCMIVFIVDEIITMKKGMKNFYHGVHGVTRRRKNSVQLRATPW
jgi:hypothetical protein